MRTEASTKWGRVEIEWPEGMTNKERSEVLQDLINFEIGFKTLVSEPNNPPTTGLNKSELK